MAEERGVQMLLTKRGLREYQNYEGVRESVNRAIRKTLEDDGCHDIVIEKPRWFGFSADNKLYYEILATGNRYA